MTLYDKIQSDKGTHTNGKLLTVKCKVIKHGISANKCACQKQ